MDQGFIEVKNQRVRRSTTLVLGGQGRQQEVAQPPQVRVGSILRQAPGAEFTAALAVVSLGAMLVHKCLRLLSILRCASRLLAIYREKDIRVGHVTWLVHTLAQVIDRSKPLLVLLE